MKNQLLVLVLVSVGVGCRPPDACNPTSTRCNSGVAEICDADHFWQPQIDCTQVSEQSGSPFVCALVSEQTNDGLVEGHTCVAAGGAGGGAS